MKKIIFYASAALLAGASIIGCNENPSPTSTSSSDMQGINNSDVRKPTYRPPTEAEKVEATKKYEMLRKVDAEWAAHLASVSASKPLAKIATTGTIGILGHSAVQSSSYLDIWFDTENDGNGDAINNDPFTTYAGGFNRVPSSHNGGMWMTLTRQTLSSLPILKYDYVVVKLSDACPTNGYSFGEVFDDEDTDNQDYTNYSSIYPGWSRRDWTGTRVEFCFVPGNGTSNTATPPWEVVIGSTQMEGSAFGLPGVEYTSTPRCHYSNTALMDGEDDAWGGYFDYEGLSSAYQTRVNAILDNQWGAPSFKITTCENL